MSASANRRSLDFSKLTFGNVISSKEALKDVTPISFSKEVLSGESKIIVQTVEKERT